jgi:ubiquinone/menaquinone biosynthesis C-methylase UbiE
MSILFSFLSLFFDLLYHSFAWTYDCVAAVVSLGNWPRWVECALPHVSGRTLEIGFGPGHLQVSLARKGLSAYGLDESRQMVRQAGHRLSREGLPKRLVRGRAERLPFPKARFDSVVATFPSEYIFSPLSLAEIRRVLVPGGRLVVIPSAWITGSRPLERLAAGLFRITGQSPRIVAELPEAVKKRFETAGFLVRSELVELKNSRVLVVLAEKTALGG